MTTSTASTHGSDPAFTDELGAYLGPGCFPATHDHLAATLIQRHAPSHLLWHLSVLPRARTFQSLQELVEQLAHSAPPPTPGSPGTRPDR